MQYRSRLITLVFLAFCGMVLFGQDAQDIIDAHGKAIGGEKAMKAVKTLERTATVHVEGQSIPLKFTQKRPLMSRQEITVEGHKIIQAYDGKTIWQVNPLAGSDAPAPVPEIQAEHIKRQAYFDDILWENQKLRKISLTYKGKVDRSGRSYHHVSVTFADGFRQDRFYDTETHLLHQIEQKVPDQTGTLLDTVTTYEDWRLVGSVKYPHVIINSLGQTVTFSDTQVNHPVPDSLFTMPQ